MSRDGMFREFSRHDEVVKVHLMGIGMSPELQLPVILLESEEDGRVLPIGVGFFEAGVIFAKLTNRQPKMRLPYDLIRMVLKIFNAIVLRVLIYEIQGNTFLSGCSDGTENIAR